MSHFPGTPEMEFRNCPECVPVGLPGLWTAITPRPDLGSRRGLNQSCSPRRELFNAVSHSRSARQEQVDSRLLVVGSQTASLTPGLLLPITWAADVQMTNARPFWTSTLRDLSNDTKNTPRRGVLGLAVELWTFGSPGGLQLPTFPSVGLHPHTWPSRGATRITTNHHNKITTNIH
jgi:hypothetical protein